MRTLTLLLLFVFNISVFAQKSMSEADIDKISYEQFQNKQFK